jgi:flagellar biosynthesis activator protein FlaF
MSSPYANRTYSQATQQPGAPRETEGRALLEAARRMDEACASGNETEMRVAARLNWRLWTIFQAELSDDKSTVPLDLRANMLNLCNFVDKRIVAVLAAPSAEQFKVLINVNRQVAAGLLAQGEQEPTPGAPTPSSGPVSA